MSEKAKVIAALAVFLVVVTFPIWYSLGAGVLGLATEYPELETDEEDEDGCIEKAEWMKANHMDLLDQWRDDVVRGDGTEQEYKSTDFPKRDPFVKSLTKTCLSCHTMEAESGDRRSCRPCHEYANVDPPCMDCHVEPKGN